MLPPNLGCDMGLPAVALLQLLETSTGLGFCHYCCHLGSRCTCMEAYQPAPPQSLSQIVEQTPGYGVTASSGGMTTPSTTVAGMSGYVAPPPGLTPPDFSSWRLLPPEAPPIWGITHSFTRPISHGEIHTSQGCSREAGSGTTSAVSKGSGTNLPRHSLWWCCTPLRWCHLSISHHLGGWQHHTSRWYSH